MAFPEIRTMDFPLDPAGAVVEARVGKQFDARQLSDKGYDFTRGVGAGYTAALEGSVSGDNWTAVVALGASGQGAVPAQFNYLRINCSVAGAYDGDVLKAAGKVL